MISNSFKIFLGSKVKNTNISFDEIKLTYGDNTIFEKLSFNITTKGISVIMGPNGSGKTLCLKLIKKLIKPESGKISFESLEKINVGYVSQKNKFLRRSVYENLEYVLKINKFNKNQIKTLIEEIIKITNFKKFINLSARSLSAGQQQLLSIMRGLVIKPNILLLDEPCSNLDPNYTNIIENLLKNINLAGIKIILVTHDVLQAKRLGDDILFISNGNIKEHINNKNKNCQNLNYDVDSEYFKKYFFNN